MAQRLLLLACGAAALLGVACLDALYEDLDPPDPAGGWVVCCQFGRVGTCPCDSASGCSQELRACAGGACVPSSAGSCNGANPDGGAPTLDGGLSDGGIPIETYVPCCRVDGGAGSVRTCPCAGGGGGCDGGAFTACRQGTCVLSGTCPE